MLLVRIRGLGAHPDPRLPIPELCTRLAAHEMKHVYCWPRPVRLSSEVVLNRYVMRFIEAVLRGEDINNIRSREARNPELDGLLVDWGIHHFHHHALLRPTAPRGDRILFAFFWRGVCFVLREGRHDFGDPSLIQLRIREFQETMEDHRLDAMHASPSSPTSSDVRSGRRSGLNFPLSGPNGEVYWSPGGGITAAGVRRGSLSGSLAIRRSVDYFMALKRDLRDLAKRTGAPPSRILLDLDEDARLTLVAADVRYRAPGFHLISFCAKQFLRPPPPLDLSRR